MSESHREPIAGKDTIVIVPCYKRPEYTEKCIKALEDAQDYEDTLFYLVDDASEDGTKEILEASKLKWKHVLVNTHNCGLRNILINLFFFCKYFKYMVKIDNDCLVPKNWLNDITGFLDTGWADIVSPNVYPSNAAYKYGSDEEVGKPGIRPTKSVGGLWAMNTDMIKGIDFELIATSKGISGAYSLLNQIITEKEPRIGWLSTVTVQDIGHWSGSHPEHIKSEEHLQYSVEVGRQIAWEA